MTNVPHDEATFYLPTNTLNTYSTEVPGGKTTVLSIKKNYSGAIIWSLNLDVPVFNDLIITDVGGCIT